MKKTVFNLVLLICMLLCIQVNAESTYSGYIIKLKNEPIALMCAVDELSRIGEKLYYADDMETVNKFIPSENIEAIFPDYEFQLFDLDYPYITSDSDFNSQWYLDKINAVSIREKGLSGRGVKIAVIDSGINSSHPDFNKTNILQGYNCTLGAEDINDCSDNVGHGTMVAGIIAAQTDNELDISGIAGNAQIIPIKITDTNSLKISSIISGLKKALETDCDIINMSFGGAISDKEALSVLKEYIDQAEEKGIIVVAAVGNSGHIDNVVNYPAGFDNVIGVGSVNEDLESSYFSQKNESVFISAPGNNIISLSKNNSTTTGMGTSLSAPIVTATVAIIKEVMPECTLQEVKELLKKTSIDSGTEGYDVNYGYGILNAENIISEISDEIPDFIISQGVLNSKKRIHIHNNSFECITSTVCFSLCGENNRIKDIEIIENVDLIDGVTNIVNEKTYENFFLWNKNLRPYTKKYSIE